MWHPMAIDVIRKRQRHERWSYKNHDQTTMQCRPIRIPNWDMFSLTRVMISCLVSWSDARPGLLIKRNIWTDAVVFHLTFDLIAYLMIHNTIFYAVVQSQKTVTADFSSKQLLAFGFAEQYAHIIIRRCSPCASPAGGALLVNEWIFFCVHQCSPNTNQTYWSSWQTRDLITARHDYYCFCLIYLRFK